MKALAAIVVATSGCAISYETADGSRRVIGLVDLTIAPPNAALAGDMISIRSLGVGVTRTDIGTAFVLGWQSTTHAAFRDHSFAVGDPDLADSLMDANGQ